MNTFFDPKAINPHDSHLEMVAASRRLHPELERAGRPTVEAMLQTAANLKMLLSEEIWEDLADLARTEPIDPQPVIYFKHRVGDGRHYIMINPLLLPNGKTQIGDTSEICILLNLEMLTFQLGLAESMDELWNLAYPEDRMAWQEAAYLLEMALAFTEPFDPSAPEDAEDALADARAIHLEELVDWMLALSAGRAASDGN